MLAAHLQSIYVKLMFIFSFSLIHLLFLLFSPSFIILSSLLVYGKTQYLFLQLTMEVYQKQVDTTGHCEVRREPSGREGLGAWLLSMEICWRGKVLKAGNYFTQLTGILL